MARGPVLHRQKQSFRVLLLLLLLLLLSGDSFMLGL